jgi:hypothetical protein
MPDSAIRNRDPQVTNKLFRMMARVDDAMVLPQQLLAGVFGDGAELVVNIGDLTLLVGDRYDSVLIQGSPQIPSFLK